MGIDNRLIAMAGEMPNFAADYINAQEQGMKVGAAQQSMAAKNKLAQMVAAKPANMPMSAYMNQQGMGDQALEYGKAEADIAKTQADTGKSALEGHLKQLDIAARFNQGLMSLPEGQLNKNLVLQNAQQYAQQGYIKPEHIAAMEQELSSVPDNDAAIRQILNMHMQRGMEAKERLGLQMQQQAQNLTMRDQDLRALNQDRNYSLDQQRLSETQGNNAFERQYKAAGLERDLTNDEIKSTLDAKKYQLDVYKTKNPQGAISASQKRQDADAVLSILDQAEPLLKDSTSSLAGAGIDAAAGAFGYSMPGAQAAAQLKALEGALISKMPKMSGPQSDKDVLLYKQMAGQIGDSTLPIETRKAAMDTIRKLNEQYATPKQGYEIPANTPPDRAKAYQDYLNGLK